MSEVSGGKTLSADDERLQRVWRFVSDAQLLALANEANEPEKYRTTSRGEVVDVRAIRHRGAPARIDPMIFTQPTTLTVWASGGEIMTRAGPLTPEAADDFYGFLCRQAAQALDSGDTHVRRYCAAIAIEVFRAMQRAQRHRQASGPVSEAA